MALEDLPPGLEFPIPLATFSTLAQMPYWTLPSAGAPALHVASLCATNLVAASSEVAATDCATTQALNCIQNYPSKK